MADAEITTRTTTTTTTTIRNDDSDEKQQPMTMEEASGGQSSHILSPPLPPPILMEKDDDNGNNDDDNGNNDDKKKKKKKELRFQHVDVHYHAYTLGDNPSASDGTPLTIEWEAITTLRSSVDHYEINRPSGARKQKTQFRLTALQRVKLLWGSGYSIQDIVQSATEAKQERRFRKKSLQRKKWDKLDFAMEKTSRTIQKVAKKTTQVATAPIRLVGSGIGIVGDIGGRQRQRRRKTIASTESFVVPETDTLPSNHNLVNVMEPRRCSVTGELPSTDQLNIDYDDDDVDHHHHNHNGILHPPLSPSASNDDIDDDHESFDTAKLQARFKRHSSFEPTSAQAAAAASATAADYSFVKTSDRSILKNSPILAAAAAAVPPPAAAVSRGGSIYEPEKSRRRGPSILSNHPQQVLSPKEIKNRKKGAFRRHSLTLLRKVVGGTPQKNRDKKKKKKNKKDKKKSKKDTNSYKVPVNFDASFTSSTASSTRRGRGILKHMDSINIHGHNNNDNSNKGKNGSNRSLMSSSNGSISHSNNTDLSDNIFKSPAGNVSYVGMTQSEGAVTAIKNNNKRRGRRANSYMINHCGTVVDSGQGMDDDDDNNNNGDHERGNGAFGSRRLRKSITDYSPLPNNNSKSKPPSYKRASITTGMQPSFQSPLMKPAASAAAATSSTRTPSNHSTAAASAAATTSKTVSTRSMSNSPIRPRSNRSAIGAGLPQAPLLHTPPRSTQSSVSSSRGRLRTASSAVAAAAASPPTITLSSSDDSIDNSSSLMDGDDRDFSTTSYSNDDDDSYYEEAEDTTTGYDDDDDDDDNDYA